jgi:hypothetical protein
MNNNLEFENEDPSPDSIEDDHPRTNYGQGYYEEPKQETTIEEAAKEFVLSHDFSQLTNPNHLANRCFQYGAKWQQERMYSEEDLRKAYFSGISSTGEGWNGEYANGNDPNIEEIFSEGFTQWFEQFKKK